MTTAELDAAFKHRTFGPVYMLGFSAIWLGGFGLLWWQTNWKVTAAVFLIAYGVLLQVHQGFVRTKDK